MSWSRAVWIEDKVKEEGVVPSIWIHKIILLVPDIQNTLKSMMLSVLP